MLSVKISPFYRNLRLNHIFGPNDSYSLLFFFYSLGDSLLPQFSPYFRIMTSVTNSDRGHQWHRQAFFVDYCSFGVSSVLTDTYKTKRM